jgi:TonB family protein
MRGLFLTVVLLAACASPEPKIDPEASRYFSQVEGQMRKAWEDLVKDKMAKIRAEGLRFNFPDDHELTTTLTLEVDQSGNVVSSKLSRSSGVKLADDAAIETLQKTPHLTALPEKYYAGKKTATVSWDFVLKIEP